MCAHLRYEYIKGTQEPNEESAKQSAWPNKEAIDHHGKDKVTIHKPHQETKPSEKPKGACYTDQGFTRSFQTLKVWETSQEEPERGKVLDQKNDIEWKPVKSEKAMTLANGNMSVLVGCL